MPRTAGFLNEIIECFKLQIPEITFLLVSILHNCCLLKENIPLIAKNNNLRKQIDHVLQADKKDLKDMLKIIKKQATFVAAIIKKYENRFASNEEILAGTGFFSLHGSVIVENEESRSILSQEITIPLSSRSTVGPYSPLKYAPTAAEYPQFSSNHSTSVAGPASSAAASVSMSARSTATTTTTNVVIVPTIPTTSQSNYNTNKLAEKLSQKINPKQEPQIVKPQIPKIVQNPAPIMTNLEEKNNISNEMSNSNESSFEDSPKLPRIGDPSRHIQFKMDNEIDSENKNMNEIIGEYNENFDNLENEDEEDDDVDSENQHDDGSFQEDEQ